METLLILGAALGLGLGAAAYRLGTKVARRADDRERDWEAIMRGEPLVD